MNHHQNINDKDLDVLLKELYLEEHITAINEPEADFVLAQEYVVAIDPAKEKALVKRLVKTTVKPARLSWYLFIGTLMVIAILLLFYFLSRSGSDDVSGHIPVSRNSAEPGMENSVKDPEAANALPVDRTIIRISRVDTFGRPRVMDLVPLADSVIITNGETQGQSMNMPYLADKDRILYQKIKEQMIHKLLQSSKDLYTHVPANKMIYAGKPLIYDAFTIRNTQITNLEYRAFLADLLAQKKEQEYLTAKLLPEYWVNDHYPTLAALYFQSDAYNDFPVVTVTTQGAGLFCKWLEEETALYIKRHHLKTTPPKIRLPYDEDWIAAAREGYAKIAFEKGYNTIYDETEKLVDEAFAHRVEIVKKRTKRIDSLYTAFTTNRYGWSEKELRTFFEKGMSAYQGVRTDTIYTPRMKVLGKIGRVSEIVLQKTSSKVWLAGLSWKSKQDYQKLEEEFKMNTASPFVGFRIVVVDPDDPEYKSPFW